MLQIGKNRQGGYSSTTAARYVNADLPLINVTEQIEEVPEYDKQQHQYLEKLDHINIYAVQNVGDYIQNPIKIKIIGHVPNDLKFGNKIKLIGLEACLVRNNGYSQVFFRAKSVEIWKGEN